MAAEAAAEQLAAAAAAREAALRQEVETAVEALAATLFSPACNPTYPSLQLYVSQVETAVEALAAVGAERELVAALEAQAETADEPQALPAE